MLLEEFMSQASEIQKNKLNNIFTYIDENYPNLHMEIKWSQPMFILKDTFVIAFSVAKRHISVAPEGVVLNKFLDEIANKYSHSKKVFKILNEQDVDFDLLKTIIDDTISLKEGYSKFWY